MAKYLVGSGGNTWDFGDAYAAASDGDVIELESGFNYRIPQGYQHNLEKNITIIGCLRKEGNTDIYENAIYGKLVIKGGTQVTLKNICIQADEDKNSLVITEKSTVSIENVVLTTEVENPSAPTLYAEDGATIKGTSLEVKKGVAKFYNATADLIKSKFLDSVIVKNRSRVTMRDTVIELPNRSGNAVSILYSEAIFTNCKISGSLQNDDNSTLWAQGSRVTLTNTTVFRKTEKTFEHGICVINGSSLKAAKSTCSSIYLDGSMAQVEGLTVNNVVSLREGSLMSSKGVLNLLGQYSKKIDLFMDDNSVLMGEGLRLNRKCGPNIRLRGGSKLCTDYISFVGGQKSDLVFQVSEDSHMMSSGSGKATATSPNTLSSSPKNIPSQSAREKLNDLVGLDLVKGEINKIIQMVEYNKIRESKGLSPEKQSLHSVFLGNPGTGKTTVARLLGEVLFENGAFSGDEYKFIEVSESDLISENVGGTALQTQSFLEKARGGVLFIDEAYTLNKGESRVNFGQEAINTILKYMEDYRDEIMVIFAGYTKEMEQFLQTNPGLKSRVPNTFVFEDYSPQEITKMGQFLLRKKQYVLEDEEWYAKRVEGAYRNSLDKSNGRWIRNFNEKLLNALASRVIEDDCDDVATIIKADIEEVANAGRYQNDETSISATDRLNQMIGITQVKKQMEQFIAVAEVNKRREELGQNISDFTLHSLFLGNPGTGKTTVARIMGDILYQKDVISQNKFIEVSRSDLVAGYVGQTAIKTRRVLESALGGVLFIDEAYTLSGNGDNDFGREAIGEILKFMEDHRRDIVIIFAGYTKEMGEFLQMNSGLRSRIPTTMNFEDYSLKDLVEIGLLDLHRSGYKIDEKSYGLLVENKYNISNDSSNGRWIRNLNEKLIMAMSIRISRTSSYDLNTITVEDINEVLT